MPPVLIFNAVDKRLAVISPVVAPIDLRHGEQQFGSLPVTLAPFISDDRNDSVASYFFRKNGIPFFIGRPNGHFFQYGFQIFPETRGGFLRLATSRPLL